MQRSFLALTKKATSIITMASMLSSMLNFGLMLPVKAQGYIEANEWQGATELLVSSTDTLASLTSYINNPYPSSGCTDSDGFWVCANPAFTNVSYAFDVSANFTIPSGSTALIKIALNEYYNPITDQGTNETWNPDWYSNGIDLDDIDTNFDNGLTVTAAIVDELSIESPNVPDTLIITLTCDGLDGFCVLYPNNGPYTIDLKNNPIIAPGQQGPVMQNFVLTDDDGVFGQSKMTINSYYQGLTVSASVDARLAFAVSAYNPSELPQVNGQEYVQSQSTGCDFGTLTPNIRYVCVWQLDASTNAVGGLRVYVVQDQNMTYPGSGAEIEQFEDGTLVESAAPAEWSSPSTAAAHLGYTSTDADVFPPDPSNWLYAGITTMTGAGAAANAGYGSLVADAYEPGDHQWLYGNIIEASTRLEQAPASLGQSYGHTQYFIVVGNF